MEHWLVYLIFGTLGFLIALISYAWGAAVKEIEFLRMLLLSFELAEEEEPHEDIWD